MIELPDYKPPPPQKRKAPGWLAAIPGLLLLTAAADSFDLRRWANHKNLSAHQKMNVLG